MQEGIRSDWYRAHVEDWITRPVGAGPLRLVHVVAFEGEAERQPIDLLGSLELPPDPELLRFRWRFRSGGAAEGVNYRAEEREADHHWTGAYMLEPSGQEGVVEQVIRKKGVPQEELEFRVRYAPMGVSATRTSRDDGEARKVGYVQVRLQILAWLRSFEPENELRHLLFERFSYWDFREHQELIVRAVVDKRDVLCVAGTGFGKSLCYQLPALFWNRNCTAGESRQVVLVVCPLISLMEDQVEQVRQARVPRSARPYSSLFHIRST